jgi:hypothetical protein
MAKKKTPVRVDPKRPKRKHKRGKGKSIKKSSYVYDVGRYHQMNRSNKCLKTS